MTIGELNAKFSIKDIAEVLEGNGGLPKIHIRGGESEGEIYLHGAQVTSWKPKGGHDVIFLSSHSHWQEGIAIRGGVPVCFPWFRAKAGDPNAPSHGFVRTRTWQLESITAEEDAVTVSMSIESDDQTKKWWPGDFRLLLHARFGSRLALELEVTNTGTTPFRFEEALHTYHRVGNIATTTIAGLEGADYLDNTDSNNKKLQQAEIAVTGPTDRAYLNTLSRVNIKDAGFKRVISMEKKDSLTTVVWNPWISGAKALSDLGDDEWAQMICVEASNIREFAVNLPAGRKHLMTSSIHVSEI
jgi:glucose-6-phosphate 1-epimerase